MQYFENDENLAHEYLDFSYNFGRHTYKFRTDSGTFSHGHIDSETAFLMANMKGLSGDFLDLGCGCGCIGIIMAKEYGLNLTQVDVNRRVIDVANYNRAQNGLDGEALLSDCYEAVSGLKFDTIALNPPIHAGKEVMYRMYDEAPLHLKEGGRFFIVIQKKHGADSTFRHLQTVFSSVEKIAKDGGVFVICCHN